MTTDVRSLHGATADGGDEAAAGAWRDVDRADVQDSLPEIRQGALMRGGTVRHWPGLRRPGN